MNELKLSEETLKRIEKQSCEYAALYSNKSGFAISYYDGARTEATRALLLLKALDKIANICNHDDYGDYNENCPVCIAKFAIVKYNNP